MTLGERWGLVASRRWVLACNDSQDLAARIAEGTAHTGCADSELPDGSRDGVQRASAHILATLQPHRQHIPSACHPADDEDRWATWAEAGQDSKSLPHTAVQVDHWLGSAKKGQLIG